jgi:hypothetical protein
MTGGAGRQRKRTRIPPEAANFIEAALQSGNPVLRKQALQRLCNLYRKGGVLAAPLRMKGFIIQAVTDTDAKVQRWAFNALAQLGDPADVSLIFGPWKAYRSDPEVFQAGLTALAKMVPKVQLEVILKEAEVALDATALMALGQQTDVFHDELAALRLRVDRATDAELREATLLIGLKRAPETLFSNRFPVCDVIGDLNSHADTTIAQYSYWATVEHPDLCLDHVRVGPADFPRLAPNVQGWAYRTLTLDGKTAIKHREALLQGSVSDHVAVREGVAIGLRDIFFDGLDIDVADWLIGEGEPSVQDALLEHMAVHAGRSSAYREEVMRAYRAEADGSVLRTRLEAANRDAGVSLEMRRVALQMNDPDLFASMIGGSVTNTMNFNGPVNAAGISNSGTGNTGQVIISVQQAETEAVAVLRELLQALESPTARDGAAEGAALAREAIEAPNKGTVERVIDWLETVKKGGQAALGVGSVASKAYEALKPLWGFLN